MNRTKSHSSSKPRPEGTSRIRRASGSGSKLQSQQQPSSSRVRIDALSVGELRKYAFEVTVKNEEYKQRLKSAHEMFVKLQDAYQRLKETKRKEIDVDVDVEEMAVVEKKARKLVPTSNEVPLGACDDTPSPSTLMTKNTKEKDAHVETKSMRKATSKTNGTTPRRSPRKCGVGVQVTDSQETPKSAVTASQLPGDFIAFPENLKLAVLTDDDENNGENRTFDHTLNELVDTPGPAKNFTNDEETPQEAMTIRKQLINQMKSPAWETIQKKKKDQTHVHLGHEHVPAPEDPVKGLQLFGNRKGTVVGSKKQLDEDRAFKYMEVIRKQDERAKLPAGFCADCARFYRVYAKHGNFEEANAMAQRMCGHTVHAQTSRHRQKWQAPDSPDDFWHVRPPEPHT